LKKKADQNLPDYKYKIGDLVYMRRWSSNTVPWHLSIVVGFRRGSLSNAQDMITFYILKTGKRSSFYQGSWWVTENVRLVP